MVGYNSHGQYCTLNEIYELETERGNSTFDDISKHIVNKYKNNNAIWVTMNVFDALRYIIPASENSLSDEELISKYPNYKNMVDEIHFDKSQILISIDVDNNKHLVILQKEVK